MSTITDETKIAGEFKVRDWKEKRIDLLMDLANETPSEDKWNAAFDIFRKRVETRFLNPVDYIIEKRKNQGEGFSAVAIQCILIEFFEAFYQGKIYIPPGYNEEKLRKISERDGIKIDLSKKHTQPNEYISSEKLFKDFLRNRPPFRDYFNSDKANRFFREIRCGLLHEAATKGASLIKSEKEDLLIEKNDNNEMIVYRSNFQRALRKYVDYYKEELLRKEELKINFIRKMDELSGIKGFIILPMEVI